MNIQNTRLAHRIVRRHQARHGAVIFRNVPAVKTRVEYSDSGRISAVELMKMLEPTTGPLVKLRFRSSMTGLPNTVAWEALDTDANVVTGTLVLHAAVSESEVLSWADVTVDEP
jgi:hypothetical protein